MICSHFYFFYFFPILTPVKTKENGENEDDFSVQVPVFPALAISSNCFHFPCVYAISKKKGTNLFIPFYNNRRPPDWIIFNSSAFLKSCFI